MHQRVILSGNLSGSRTAYSIFLWTASILLLFKFPFFHYVNENDLRLVHIYINSSHHPRLIPGIREREGVKERK